MLIQKTGTSKYMQGTITAIVTRTNGQQPEYTISNGEDFLYDLSEVDVRDLLAVLEKMKENGDVTPIERPKLTPR